MSSAAAGASLAEIEASLDRYVEQHIPTGGFLRAVLANDLFSAVHKADDINRHILPAIALAVYDRVPTAMRGSYERINDHLSRGRNL